MPARMCVVFQQFAHTTKAISLSKRETTWFFSFGQWRRQQAKCSLVLTVDLNLEYLTHRYCNSEEGRQRPPKIQKKNQIARSLGMSITHRNPERKK